MQITILGSGTLASNKLRNPSGYLVHHNKKTALIDFGPGNLLRLIGMRQDTLAISEIFLSHFHLDHCADVFPLLLNRHLLKANTNSGLSIYGPEGLKNWFNTMASVQGSWLQKSLPKLFELNDSSLDWAGLSVTTKKNKHSVPGIAYRFQGKKSFFYSGDTEFQPQLCALAYQADVAIVECSHSDQNNIAGHMSASETGKFATEAKVKKLVPTHIYPENDTNDLKSRISSTFSGDIVIAQDLLSFDLS